MAIKFREIIQIIEDDGIRFDKKVAIGSSNMINKTGIVTIAYHSLKDPVPAGTLSSIHKQAQLER